jgi:Protein of unknown function (DUF3563)
VTALKKCLDWLLRDVNFQREAYFSAATDVADLERRIRKWERNAQGLFG